MIVFICLNCDAVDPPFDKNHKCLLCYNGSVIINDTIPELDLNAYLFMFKDLIKAQADMIKSSGKCLGYDNKVYSYSSIEQYIEESSKMLVTHLTSNETYKEIKCKLEDLIYEDN